jgi:hypothetical protein
VKVGLEKLGKEEGEKVGAKVVEGVAEKGAKKIKGSYVHEFESGKEYVGKGTEQRMKQSGKRGRAKDGFRRARLRLIVCLTKW